MIRLHSFALVKVSKSNPFPHRLLMFKNICRISIIFHRIIVIQLICSLHAALWQTTEHIGTDNILSFLHPLHVYPPMIAFILNHIPDVRQLMSQINPSKRLKFFLTFLHSSLHRSFQPTLLISSQSLEEGLFFSPSLLIDHLQC